MTLGTLLGGRLADWSVRKTLVLAPLATLVIQLAFTMTAHAVVPAALTLLLIAFASSASLPALTARLLDVSGDGKALAATMNHSSLNVANAIGAWLGGLVIAAGLGYTAPAVVGAGLSAAGLGVLAVSFGLERRDRRQVAPASRSARRPDPSPVAGSRRRDRLTSHGPCGVARCSTTSGSQPAPASTARSGSSRQRRSAAARPCGCSTPRRRLP